MQKKFNIGHSSSHLDGYVQGRKRPINKSKMGEKRRGNGNQRGGAKKVSNDRCYKTPLSFQTNGE